MMQKLWAGSLKNKILYIALVLAIVFGLVGIWGGAFIGSAFLRPALLDANALLTSSNYVTILSDGLGVTANTGNNEVRTTRNNGNAKAASSLTGGYSYGDDMYWNLNGITSQADNNGQIAWTSDGVQIIFNNYKLFGSATAGNSTYIYSRVKLSDDIVDAINSGFIANTLSMGFNFGNSGGDQYDLNTTSLTSSYAMNVYSSAPTGLTSTGTTMINSISSGTTNGTVVRAKNGSANVSSTFVLKTSGATSGSHAYFTITSPISTKTETKFLGILINSREYINALYSNFFVNVNSVCNTSVLDFNNDIARYSGYTGLTGDNSSYSSGSSYIKPNEVIYLESKVSKIGDGTNTNQLPLLTNLYGPVTWAIKDTSNNALGSAYSVKAENFDNSIAQGFLIKCNDGSNYNGMQIKFVPTFTVISSLGTQYITHNTGKVLTVDDKAPVLTTSNITGALANYAYDGSNIKWYTDNSGKISFTLNYPQDVSAYNSSTPSGSARKFLYTVEAPGSTISTDPRFSGNTIIANVAASASGSTTIDIENLSTPGAYTVKFAAVDAVGNVSNVVPFTFFYDPNDYSINVNTMAATLNATFTQIVDPGVISTAANIGIYQNVEGSLNEIQVSANGTAGATFKRGSEVWIKFTQTQTQKEKYQFYILNNSSYSVSVPYTTGTGFYDEVYFKFVVGDGSEQTVTQTYGGATPVISYVDTSASGQDSRDFIFYYRIKADVTVEPRSSQGYTDYYNDGVTTYDAVYDTYTGSPVAVAAYSTNYDGFRTYLREIITTPEGELTPEERIEAILTALNNERNSNVIIQYRLNTLADYVTESGGSYYYHDYLLTKNETTGNYDYVIGSTPYSIEDIYKWTSSPPTDKGEYLFSATVTSEQFFNKKYAYLIIEQARPSVTIRSHAKFVYGNLFSVALSDDPYFFTYDCPVRGTFDILETASTALSRGQASFSEGVYTLPVSYAEPTASAINTFLNNPPDAGDWTVVYKFTPSGGAAANYQTVYGVTTITVDKNTKASIEFGKYLPTDPTQQAIVYDKDNKAVLTAYWNYTLGTPANPNINTLAAEGDYLVPEGSTLVIKYRNVLYPESEWIIADNFVVGLDTDGKELWADGKGGSYKCVLKNIENAGSYDVIVTLSNSNYSVEIIDDFTIEKQTISDFSYLSAADQSTLLDVSHQIYGTFDLSVFSYNIYSQKLIDDGIISRKETSEGSSVYAWRTSDNSVWGAFSYYNTLDASYDVNRQPSERAMLIEDEYGAQTVNVIPYQIKYTIELQNYKGDYTVPFAFDKANPSIISSGWPTISVISTAENEINQIYIGKAFSAIRYSGGVATKAGTQEEVSGTFVINNNTNIVNVARLLTLEQATASAALNGGIVEPKGATNNTFAGYVETEWRFIPSDGININTYNEVTVYRYVLVAKALPVESNLNLTPLTYGDLLNTFCTNGIFDPDNVNGYTHGIANSDFIVVTDEIDSGTGSYVLFNVLGNPVVSLGALPLNTPIAATSASSQINLNMTYTPSSNVFGVSNKGTSFTYAQCFQVVSTRVELVINKATATLAFDDVSQFTDQKYGEVVTPTYNVLDITGSVSETLKSGITIKVKKKNSGEPAAVLTSDMLSSLDYRTEGYELIFELNNSNYKLNTDPLLTTVTYDLMINKKELTLTSDYLGTPVKIYNESSVVGGGITLGESLSSVLFDNAEAYFYSPLDVEITMDGENYVISGTKLSGSTLVVFSPVPNEPNRAGTWSTYVTFTPNNTNFSAISYYMDITIFKSDNIDVPLNGLDNTVTETYNEFLLAGNDISSNISDQDFFDFPSPNALTSLGVDAGYSGFNTFYFITDPNNPGTLDFTDPQIIYYYFMWEGTTPSNLAGIRPRDSGSYETYLVLESRDYYIRKQFTFLIVPKTLEKVGSAEEDGIYFGLLSVPYNGNTLPLTSQQVKVTDHTEVRRDASYSLYYSEQSLTDGGYANAESAVYQTTAPKLPGQYYVKINVVDNGYGNYVGTAYEVYTVTKGGITATIASTNLNYTYLTFANERPNIKLSESEYSYLDGEVTQTVYLDDTQHLLVYYRLTSDVSPLITTASQLNTDLRTLDAGNYYIYLLIDDERYQLTSAQTITVDGVSYNTVRYPLVIAKNTTMAVINTLSDNYTSVYSMYDYTFDTTSPNVTVENLPDGVEYSIICTYMAGGTSTYVDTKPLNANTYNVKLSISNNNFEAEKVISLTISKKTPYISAVPTLNKAVYYGDSLNDESFVLNLDGAATYSSLDATAVSGTFDFINRNITFTQNTSVTLVFTPDNTLNYNPNTVTLNVELTKINLLASAIALTDENNLTQSYNGLAKSLPVTVTYPGFTFNNSSISVFYYDKSNPSAMSDFATDCAALAVYDDTSYAYAESMLTDRSAYLGINIVPRNVATYNYLIVVSNNLFRGFLVDKDGENFKEFNIVRGTLVAHISKPSSALKTLNLGDSLNAFLQSYVEGSGVGVDLFTKQIALTCETNTNIILEYGDGYSYEISEGVLGGISLVIPDPESPLDYDRIWGAGPHQIYLTIIPDDTNWNPYVETITIHADGQSIYFDWNNVRVDQVEGSVLEYGRLLSAAYLEIYYYNVSEWVLVTTYNNGVYTYVETDYTYLLPKATDGTNDIYGYLSLYEDTLSQSVSSVGDFPIYVQFNPTYYDPLDIPPNTEYHRQYSITTSEAEGYTIAGYDTYINSQPFNITVSKTFTYTAENIVGSVEADELFQSGMVSGTLYNAYNNEEITGTFSLGIYKNIMSVDRYNSLMDGEIPDILASEDFARIFNGGTVTVYFCFTPTSGDEEKYEVLYGSFDITVRPKELSVVFDDPELIFDNTEKHPDGQIETTVYNATIEYNNTYYIENASGTLNLEGKNYSELSGIIPKDAGSYAMLTQIVDASGKYFGEDYKVFEITRKTYEFDNVSKFTATNSSVSFNNAEQMLAVDATELYSENKINFYISYDGGLSRIYFVYNAVSSAYEESFRETYNGSIFVLAASPESVLIPKYVKTSGESIVSYDVVIYIDEANYAGEYYGCTFTINPSEVSINDFTVENTEVVYVSSDYGDITPVFVRVVFNGYEILSTDPVGERYILVKYKKTTQYENKYTTNVPTEAGNYDVSIMIVDKNIKNPASTAYVVGYTISKAEVNVAVTNVSQNYSMKMIEGILVSQIIDPEISFSITYEQGGVNYNESLDLEYTVTYDGNLTRPTTVGEYEMLITVNDPNYTGIFERLFTITKARTIVNKNNRALPLNTIIYGQSLFAVALGDLNKADEYIPQAIDDNGNIIAGFFSYTYASLYNEAGKQIIYNAGSQTDIWVYFTPIDTDNYLVSDSYPVSVSVLPAQVNLKLNNLNQSFGAISAVTVELSGASTNDVIPIGIAYYNYKKDINGNYLLDVDSNFILEDEPLQGLPVNVGYYGVIAEVVYMTGANNNYSGRAVNTMLIEKGEPEIKTQPTSVSIFYGESLAKSSILGGEIVLHSQTVPGSFQFLNTGTIPTNAGIHLVPIRFIPSDYRNINELVFNISLTVKKRTVSFSINNSRQTYDGTGKAVEVIANPISVVPIVTYNDLPELPVNAGTYIVKVSIDDSNQEGSAVGVLVIEKQKVNVAILGNMNQNYGSFVALSATVSSQEEDEDLPYALPILITYNGDTALPVSVGVYTVVAKVDDANFKGEISQNLSINKIDVSDSIEIERLEQVYGSVLAPLVSTDPYGAKYTISYNNSPIMPTTVGVYDIKVTINDKNMSGTKTALFSITSKKLTVTNLVAEPKAYNGDVDINVTGTLVGVIYGDIVNLKVSAHLENASIGTSKKVYVEGYSISGLNASNYVIEQPKGADDQICEAHNCRYDLIFTAITTTTLIVSAEDGREGSYLAAATTGQELDPTLRIKLTEVSGDKKESVINMFLGNIRQAYSITITDQEGNQVLLTEPVKVYLELPDQYKNADNLSVEAIGELSLDGIQFTIDGNYIIFTTARSGSIALESHEFPYWLILVIAAVLVLLLGLPLATLLNPERRLRIRFKRRNNFILVAPDRPMIAGEPEPKPVPMEVTKRDVRTIKKQVRSAERAGAPIPTSFNIGNKNVKPIFAGASMAPTFGTGMPIVAGSASAPKFAPVSKYGRVKLVYATPNQIKGGSPVGSTGMAINDVLSAISESQNLAKNKKTIIAPPLNRNK